VQKIEKAAKENEPMPANCTFTPELYYPVADASLSQVERAEVYAGRKERRVEERRAQQQMEENENLTFHPQMESKQRSIPRMSLVERQAEHAGERKSLLGNPAHSVSVVEAQSVPRLLAQTGTTGSTMRSQSKEGAPKNNSGEHAGRTNSNGTLSSNSGDIISPISYGDVSPRRSSLKTGPNITRKKHSVTFSEIPEFATISARSSMAESLSPSASPSGHSNDSFSSFGMDDSLPSEADEAGPGEIDTELAVSSKTTLPGEIGDAANGDSAVEHGETAAGLAVSSETSLPSEVGDAANNDGALGPDETAAGLATLSVGSLPSEVGDVDEGLPADVGLPDDVGFGDAVGGADEGLPADVGLPDGVGIGNDSAADLDEVGLPDDVGFGDGGDEELPDEIGLPDGVGLGDDSHPADVGQPTNVAVELDFGEDAF
jgi:hypothetical protein